MSDSEHPDETVGDDVQWYRDPDGTEWFADDGVRFELADDGFAYPVVGGTTDPAGATPLEVVAEDEDGDDPHDGEESTATAAGDVEQADADDTADADGEDTATSPFAPGRAETTRIVTVKVEDAGEGASPATAAEETPRAADRSLEVEPLLEIKGLDAGYGTLPVLNNVDLAIRPGETAVLLGLNGAGKTTTVSIVAGALSPWGGQIIFDGEDIAGWNARAAVANGVVMVPEGRRVFPDLSVGRNLQVGAWAKRGDRDYVEAQRERVFDYFPRLREREGQLAGTLSGGEQQMLAVGRGLMADPRLLIIDEASMGLAPVIVQDVFDIVAQINEDGVTVLMVEQNVGVLEVADVGYVMEQGRIVRVLEGEELRDRSVVSEALMG